MQMAGQKPARAVKRGIPRMPAPIVEPMMSIIPLTTLLMFIKSPDILLLEYRKSSFRSISLKNVIEKKSLSALEGAMRMAR
jgi:hypothetical protein